MSINTVALDGRIVSDVQLRKTKRDHSVLNFRLKHKDPRQKNPVYVDVEVWARAAEELAENASRNSFVLVHGEIRRDMWEQDGETRAKLKITADKVIVDTNRSSRSDSASMNVKF